MPNTDNNQALLDEDNQNPDYPLATAVPAPREVIGTPLEKVSTTRMITAATLALYAIGSIFFVIMESKYPKTLGTLDCETSSDNFDKCTTLSCNKVSSITTPEMNIFLSNLPDVATSSLIQICNISCTLEAAFKRKYSPTGQAGLTEECELTGPDLGLFLTGCLAGIASIGIVIFCMKMAKKPNEMNPTQGAIITQDSPEGAQTAETNPDTPYANADTLGYPEQATPHRTALSI